jgi:Secretion system C-terminal sorting domain
VIVKVYNILGVEVATLVNAVKAAGNYSIEFNAGKFASGVYFCRMQAGGFNETRKLILLK